MPDLTREAVLTILREQRKVLHERFHVERIGIFGSVARNEATETSDIDFLVEFDAPIEKYVTNRYELIDHLRSVFGREVDMANPRYLKPFYKDLILNDAVYA